jgi:caffeoyl-CoA O-methyltransferase
MAQTFDNPHEYFSQLIPARDALLADLESEARQEGIPIVGPLVGELLFVLARAVRAVRILELGTATGYSAIHLARACEPFNGQVVTVEIDRAMADRARVNFAKADLDGRITVRLGDALQQIAAMRERYDMIFMDIEKKDYVRALPDCRRLLRQGGLLVADNTAFKDADAFNRRIANSPDWRSVALFSFLPFHSPENDAVCLALRV